MLVSAHNNSSRTPHCQSKAPEPRLADWLILSFIALLSLSLFLPGLGAIKILDPSDGYYSEGAREMVELGNFLTPHLNYQPWFDKPILTYWLIALSYKLFGVNEFAARLPSALCGAGLVTFIYWFGRHFLRQRAALLSALVLLASPLFIVMGHMSLTDMPLCFFIWLSLGSLFIALNKQSIFSARWLGYVGLGLGILCKGPVALLLVALSLSVSCAITSNSLTGALLVLRSLRPISGLALAAAISAPWYIAETIATKGAFFQHFFLQENISRALGHVDHKQHFWYYMPVLIAGFFPWSIMLPSAMIVAFRAWSQRLTSNLCAKLTIFSAVTAATIFLFYSALPTKLVTYMLPILPALALVIGISLDKLMRLARSSALELIGLVLSIIGIMAVASLPTALQKFPSFPSAIIFPIVLLSLVFICSFALLWRRQFKSAIYLLTFGTLVVVGMLVPTGLRVAYDLKCRDFHKLIAVADERHITPALVGRRSPSAIFYLKRPLRFFTGPPTLAAFINQTHSSQFVLIDEACLQTLAPAVGPTQTIAHAGKWYLLEAHAKIQ